MSTTTPEPLLTVRDLGAPPFGNSPPLWSGISFDLVPGEILCLRGPSGAGKSVLLKSLAYLLPNTTGTVLLHSQSAPALGVPLWRSKVLYLPQRPALLPGTPSEFFSTLKGFKCRKGKETGDPREIAREWGVGEELWERKWAELSGGEGQRIALAVGLALRPEVLLLDEPTSALDARSAALVEETVMRGTPTGRQTCIWITHSDEQAKKVATRTLDITPFLHSEV